MWRSPPLKRNFDPSPNAWRENSARVASPDSIAEAYWQLHQQHPSPWTHELDLRPYKEAF
jgi:hypothetical protein